MIVGWLRWLQFRWWQLLRRISFGDPYYEYAELYEIMIRAARRCAYDLLHTVWELPEKSTMRRMGIEHRASHWRALFQAGNGVKDYRQGLVEERDRYKQSYERALKDIDQLGYQLFLKLHYQWDPQLDAANRELWIQQPYDEPIRPDEFLLINPFVQVDDEHPIEVIYNYEN